MVKYLGIDPGSKWGWAVAKSMEQSHNGSSKFTSLLAFEKEIIDLLFLYNPKAVITCRAMGPHAQVTRYHAAMAGVVELTCQRKEVSYFDIADGTMRKVVIGKGNAKKQEVMDFLKIENEHAADAMVAALYIAQMGVEHN